MLICGCRTTFVVTWILLTACCFIPATHVVRHILMLKILHFVNPRPMTCRKGVEVWLYSFFNLGVRWGGWLTLCPDHFAFRNDPVPVVWEAGWAPGPVWTGAENLAPTGIWSPDVPAHSESPCRLSCRDLHFSFCVSLIVSGQTSIMAL